MVLLPALKNVNLSLTKGEFQVLIGEHGSGKSSLCKIISGLIKPSTGLIYSKSRSYTQLDVQKAHALGIHIVTQDSHMLDDLSVADNFFLIKQQSQKVFYNKKIEKQIIKEFIEKCGVVIDLNIMVKKPNITTESFVSNIKTSLPKTQNSYPG